MDNQEYIIISKTALLKRIEELEKSYNHYLKVNDVKSCEILNHTREELKQMLSQSTPLIPEIEKAFNAGSAYTIGSHESFVQTHPNKKEYISSLKFDI